jgi:hypothetical protein
MPVYACICLWVRVSCSTIPSYPPMAHRASVCCLTVFSLTDWLFLLEYIVHNPSRPEHFSTVYLQSITMDIRQWKGRGCVLYFACQMSWWCAFYLLERKWKGECARAIHPAVKNYTVEFGFPNHYVSHNQRIIHPVQWCTLRSFSLIGERDQRRSGKLPEL